MKKQKKKSEVKSKAKIIKEIKEEIAWYNPPKAISNAMLALGELGFESSDHGCGMGSEDWSLIKEYKDKKTGKPFFTINVELYRMGKKLGSSVNGYDNDDFLNDVFRKEFKSPAKAVKFAEKMLPETLKKKMEKQNVK